MHRSSGLTINHWIVDSVIIGQADNSSVCFRHFSFINNAGKFNRHLDYWDAIENQQYFSWEAFGHVLQQMTDVSKIPKDLPTPSYTILKKFKEFEIRRCSTHSAQCLANSTSAMSSGHIKKC